MAAYTLLTVMISLIICTNEVRGRRRWIAPESLERRDPSPDRMMLRDLLRGRLPRGEDSSAFRAEERSPMFFPQPPPLPIRLRRPMHVEPEALVAFRGGRRPRDWFPTLREEQEMFPIPNRPIETMLRMMKPLMDEDRESASSAWKDVLSPEEGSQGPWRTNTSTNAAYLSIPVLGIDPSAIDVNVNKGKIIVMATQEDDVTTDHGNGYEMSKEDFHEEFLLPYPLGDGNIDAFVKDQKLIVRLPPPLSSSDVNTGRGGEEEEEEEEEDSKPSSLPSHTFYTSDTLPVR